MINSNKDDNNIVQINNKQSDLWNTTQLQEKENSSYVICLFTAILCSCGTLNRPQQFKKLDKLVTGISPKVMGVNMGYQQLVQQDLRFSSLSMDHRQNGHGWTVIRCFCHCFWPITVFKMMVFLQSAFVNTDLITNRCTRMITKCSVVYIL